MKVIKLITLSFFMSAQVVYPITKSRVYIKNRTKDKTFIMKKATRLNGTILDEKDIGTQQSTTFTYKDKIIKPKQVKVLFEVDRDQPALFSKKQPYEEWGTELENINNQNCKISLIVRSQRGKLANSLLGKGFEKFVKDPIKEKNVGKMLTTLAASPLLIPTGAVAAAGDLFRRIEEQFSSIGTKYNVSKECNIKISHTYALPFGRIVYKDLYIYIDDIPTP